MSRILLTVKRPLNSKIIVSLCRTRLNKNERFSKKCKKKKIKKKKK